MQPNEFIIFTRSIYIPEFYFENKIYSLIQNFIRLGKWKNLKVRLDSSCHPATGWLSLDSCCPYVLGGWVLFRNYASQVALIIIIRDLMSYKHQRIIIKIWRFSFAYKKIVCVIEIKKIYWTWITKK